MSDIIIGARPASVRGSKLLVRQLYAGGADIAHVLAATTDNYGMLYATGTPISLRDDFNTLDNPFAIRQN